MNAGLREAIKELRLSGLKESLDVRLAEAAGAAINYNDLTALLYLQGYSDDEIITPV